MLDTVPNYIGGAWIHPASSATAPVVDPASGAELVLAPRSGEGDVDRAVTVAREAFAIWRRVAPFDRTRPLLRFRELLEERQLDLARAITLEQGKTLDEARAEVRQAIATVAHACASPAMASGGAREDLVPGVDADSVRRPIGVGVAITSSDLPALGPLWFWPYALAAGNAFVVKPSERVALAQRLLFELVDEAGFPAGVLNLVHGDRDTAAALARHPGVDAVSFVGRADSAQAAVRLAAHHGKRVQVFTGATTQLVVLPDADLDRVVPVLLDSAFGCAGQRVLAGSAVLAVGAIADELVDRLVRGARAIVVGDGLDPAVGMGPLASGRALDRIVTILHEAAIGGARLIVDGRGAEAAARKRGWFLGPSIVEAVPGTATLAVGEAFGPVLAVERVGDLDGALAAATARPAASAASLFTTSGPAARAFRQAASAALVGVNVGTPAPAPFAQRGMGAAFLDLETHGREAVEFFTDARVVVSRW